MSAHVTPYRAFRPRRVSVTKKVAFTAAAVGVAAAASGGVLAAWSQTSSLISGSYTTGIVTTSFTDTGTNAWTTSVPNLIPGDYVYRYLRIDNTGTDKQDFALTVAGVTNGTDNAWASDPSLRITVTRCAVAWTQATNSCGNSPATRHHDTAGQHRQRQLPGADRRGPVRGDVPAGQAGTGRQRPEQRPGAQREGPAHRDRDAAGRNPAMTRKR